MSSSHKKLNSDTRWRAKKPRLEYIERLWRLFECLSERFFASGLKKNDRVKITLKAFALVESPVNLPKVTRGPVFCGGKY